LCIIDGIHNRGSFFCERYQTVRWISGLYDFVSRNTRFAHVLLQSGCELQPAFYWCH
jgi:hypothetical protein